MKNLPIDEKATFRPIILQKRSLEATNAKGVLKSDWATFMKSCLLEAYLATLDCTQYKNPGSC